MPPTSHNVRCKSRVLYARWVRSRRAQLTGRRGEVISKRRPQGDPATSTRPQRHATAPHLQPDTRAPSPPNDKVNRAAASDASFENDRIGGSACIASLSGGFLHNWRTHHGCTLWTRDRQITFPIPIVLGANGLRATTVSAEIYLAFNAGETRAAKYSRGNPPDGAPITIPVHSAHHTRSAIEAGETTTEEPAYQ